MDAAISSNERAQMRALTQGINLSAIKERLPALEAFCNRKIEAAEDFKNAVQLAALQTGLIPSVLAQYVTARCNDSVTKKAQSAEQLSLLFGEEI